MLDIVADALRRTLGDFEFRRIDIAVDADGRVVAGDPAPIARIGVEQGIGEEISGMMADAFEPEGTAAFDFDLGRGFGQHAPVALQGGGREKEADFERPIRLAGALPGGDEGTGFQYKLPDGGAILAAALAGPLAEPAADVEPALRCDRLHPLAQDVDQHRLRGTGRAVLVALFVREVAAGERAVAVAGELGIGAVEIAPVEEIQMEDIG